MTAAGLAERIPVLAAQSPPPSDGGYPDAELVTPGTIGFVSTFVLVVAVVILLRSLVRRQRRLRARLGVVRRHPIPVERGPRTARAMGQDPAAEQDGAREEESAGLDENTGPAENVVAAEDADDGQTAQEDGAPRHSPR